MTNNNDNQRPAHRHKDDVRDAMRGEPGVDMWSVRMALDKHARFIEGTEHDDGLDYPLHIRTDAGHESAETAYYRVHGPNGPVEYRNSSGEAHTVPMLSLVIDLLRHDGEEVPEAATPWDDA